MIDILCRAVGGYHQLELARCWGSTFLCAVQPSTTSRQSQASPSSGRICMYRGAPRCVALDADGRTDPVRSRGRGRAAGPSCCRDRRRARSVSFPISPRQSSSRVGQAFVSVVLVKTFVEIWTRRAPIKAILNVSAHALMELVAVSDLPRLWAARASGRFRQPPRFLARHEGRGRCRR